MTKIEFKAQLQALGLNANTIVKLADSITDDASRTEFLTALVDVPEKDRQLFAEKRLNPVPAQPNAAVIIRKPEQGSELGKVSAIRLIKLMQELPKIIHLFV